VEKILMEWKIFDKKKNNSKKTKQNIQKLRKLKKKKKTNVRYLNYDLNRLSGDFWNISV